MKFNINNYSDETVEKDGIKLSLRAYRNIVFVEKPIDDKFHRMNIYAPLPYFNGQSVNGYNIKSAPVFMPNAVGGYRPGEIKEPDDKTIFYALNRGYVVVSPAIRGRTLKDKNGKNYGVAPACIVDYKAAARFLHYFAAEIPGNADKIITNGTSAGGALSSLMGATGNHPDYQKYLKNIGAAGFDDSVFACSCYCPITNLDNADMAYEWQFDGVYDYHKRKKQTDENGNVYFTPVSGVMDSVRIGISRDECKMFPAYLNSLNLKNSNGEPITLNENGEGSFKEYLKGVILASAQRALDGGENLSCKTWLKIIDGKAVEMDFNGYAEEITRQKTAPAFDDITMDSAENNLFGNADEDFAHFTKYSMAHSQTGGNMADLSVVKMLNPTCYINDKKAKKAKFFRIRHGEKDRDTSLAISAILTLMLQEAGCEVDYFSPWDTPHSGDYDLNELFNWIDGIAK